MSIQKLKAIIPAVIATTLLLPLLFPFSHAAKAAEGPYLSIWGGFAFIDAPEVEGFSQGDVFLFPFIQTPVFRADPEEGFFFGASVGTTLNPSTHFFNMFEIYFEGQRALEDRVNSLPGFFETFIPASDGNIVTILFSSGFAELERDRYEGGVNLVLKQSANFNITMNPFGGVGSENALSVSTNGVNVLATPSEVDWHFYGLMIGAEISQSLFNNVEIVLSGSGGIYHYNAGLVSRTTGDGILFNGPNEDSDTDFGFRGKAQIELRTDLGEGVLLSAFGGVDYWSDVPFTNHRSVANTLASPPTNIDTDDQLDLKAGIKLVLPLGS